MITITNKNIYFSDFSLIDLTSLDMIERVPLDGIINFLSDEIELGESVTFKRIFEIISHNVNKFNEIFFSSLGGHLLDPFLQEIENNPSGIIESEYLEINWFCDKYEDELTIFPSIHGISDKSDIAYALDFVPLNNIKNYNVRINKTVEIFDFKVNETGEPTKIFIGNKSFTLFEFFNAIFYEITFHGAPLDKKNRFNELEDSIHDVETNLDELKHDSKLKSFDDMLEELDSKDKYLVKYNELRGRLEENRINKKKNLNKLKACLLEKLKLYDIIDSSIEEDLKHYYKKLTNIEYDMQILYGEDENISFHRFWETPKCTCPIIDNIELYPFRHDSSNNTIYYVNDKCPIHGK
jgi:hypothetical protein